MGRIQHDDRCALELEPSSSSSFADVKGKWYENDIQALFEAGIVKGYDNGKFGANDTLTREQAATMVARMLDYMGLNTKEVTDVTFKAEGAISDYAKKAVDYLASQDILINGDETNFNPCNNLTRAEKAKVLLRSLSLTEWY